MKLKVVGVGPQKTGTTWLDMCLREHSQLCFPRGTKETFFFDERFDKDWAWYWHHFQHCANGQLCAEIGPSYFDIPEVPMRIYKHNPECHIIINLRDPAARSFSLYLHHKNKGRLNCDFSEAIQKMPRIIESSRYRNHLSRWIETFGRERILIILQDDISSFPNQVLESVYKFIGIANSPLPNLARERVNVATSATFPSLARFFHQKAKWFRDKRLYGCINLLKTLGLKRLYLRKSSPLPVLDYNMRKTLIKEFESDITYVENVLHRSLPHWRK